MINWDNFKGFFSTGVPSEAISPETGVVVEQGDVTGMAEAVRSICNQG